MDINLDDFDKQLDDMFKELSTNQLSTPSRATLEEKLLDDFHGNPLIMNEELEGQLPKVDASANEYLVKLIKETPEADYFRLGIRGGGCSGLQYEMHLEADESITDKDIVIQESPKVIIDNESIKYMAGCTIKWVTANFASHMEIDNPAAKQGCGCGSSFSV